jgi:hypothetical protein
MTYETRIFAKQQMRLLALFQAGGNMGGDCDHQGRPVEDGAFYFEHKDRVVAGPFKTERAALEWLDDANAFDAANASGFPERKRHA